MSTPKFSMFTPGRGFKNPSPVNRNNRPENPFRKSSPPKKKSISPHTSHQSANYQPHQRSDICKNCGVQGHPIWKCPQPLSSYGILLVRGTHLKDAEIAMIIRKDSYDYITLVKNIDIDPKLFPKIATGLTLLEKQKILTKTFQDMWIELFGHTKYAHNKKVYNLSKERFEKFNIRSIVYDIKDVELSSCVCWSLPKGKPLSRETGQECALRELKEEINVYSDQIKIIHKDPVYHLRNGSDGRSYLGVYYVCLIDPNSEIEFKAQPTEIQAIEWKPLKFLKRDLHQFPYNETKDILTQLFGTPVLGESSRSSSSPSNTSR